MRRKSRKVDSINPNDRHEIEDASSVRGLPPRKVNKKGLRGGVQKTIARDFGTTTVSQIAFVVHGLPIAQPRHRATARNGYVHLYLPTDHPVHAYKRLIAAAALEQKKGVIEGAIRLDILFSFLPAKSARGIKTQFKISKPDLDNLAKAVKDAITDSGLWIDDAQVVEMHIAKIIGKVQATSITIRGVDFPIEVLG